MLDWRTAAYHKEAMYHVSLAATVATVRELPPAPGLENHKSLRWISAGWYLICGQ